jgi:hypothetical protein
MCSVTLNGTCGNCHNSLDSVKSHLKQQTIKNILYYSQFDFFLLLNTFSMSTLPIIQYVITLTFSDTKYVVGSKSVRPDQLFKVTEIK